MLIGRRFKDDGPEIILPGLEWQMPQGGIDAGEEPYARRSSASSTKKPMSAPRRAAWRDWRLALLRHSDAARGPRLEGRRYFVGQRQKWFAFRFTGDERRDRSADAAQRPAARSSTSWRWERLDRVADLVVPFRREVYTTVAKAFASFI